MPETYPMPLLPILPPSTRHNTEPLFLPEPETKDSPQLASSVPPTAPTKPPHLRKTRDLVVSSDNPPAGSLAAELIAEAAYQASAKEHKAVQLDDLIKNNTNPTEQGCHASAKEKKSAQASTGKFLSSAAPPPLLTILLVYSAVDTTHVLKTLDGLAIWLPCLEAAAATPQVPNAVSPFSPHYFRCC